MLLEMQSAMNNSQLHGSGPSASGSQTQPCLAKLASGAAPHAAPSFSPASSPQSSQSELSSDPEPALPMDTSPSSDSSSATDSGEEEVAGTGTRPGRKAEHLMEDTKEVWNHHNNLATVTHQLPRLPCTPQNPHTVEEEEDSLSRCPVRMSNSASSGQCHVQLLANADPTYPCSASMVGQSRGAHNSNGTQANGYYAGPAWSGGNRMHLVCTSDLNLNDPSQFKLVFDIWLMIFQTVCCFPEQVCPMNTSPYVDPRKSGHAIWEEFSMSFTPAVREVVEFAKRIPGFRELSQHDQISLLKAGTFEVCTKSKMTLLPFIYVVSISYLINIYIYYTFTVSVCVYT